jgi:hypothetical protein
MSIKFKNQITNFQNPLKFTEYSLILINKLGKKVIRVFKEISLRMGLHLTLKDLQRLHFTKDLQLKFVSLKINPK